MSRFWTLVTQLHILSGPVLMLLYPLYASVVAIESTSKLDDEQWLAYWIIYSFLTLMEMVLQPVLEWSVLALDDFPLFFSFQLQDLLRLRDRMGFLVVT
ncbi:HVA22-like protein e isoform X2 [Cucurbita maxima]|uniref:HVA22-like protein n=1 Tax=Cucurbita maxima TaxID=3661 RepID=A0A6J1JL16_CUCMA|nr:HVA22-like protein e isoform X2 [Cucurbita maxima]